MSEELGAELLEIDALLRRTAGELTYPRTPDITSAVSARLREPAPVSVIVWLLGTVRRWWWKPAFRMFIAVSAVALVVVSVALAIPQSRTALAEFFGLSRVRVEMGPQLSPTPPVLSPDSFARPASLRSAQEAVDFPLRFPTSDGLRQDPDAMYVQGEGSQTPVVIFVYEEQRLDLYQSSQALFYKRASDPSLVQEIEFAGHPALWIAEGGHIASFLDEQGRMVIESRRTVGRATLLWEEQGITYRLETSLSREEAIRVAESLR